MATKKRGLGMGLDALFVDNASDELTSGGGPSELRMSEVEPDRTQPRKDFDDDALAELADSIAQHGVLQPILVRPLPGGTYQIADIKYHAMRPDDPENIQKISDGHEAAYAEVSAKDLLTGKVDIDDSVYQEVLRFADYARLKHDERNK